MASRLDLEDETDFYPTPPWGARAGGEFVRRLDPAARTVWEPACGALHMAHGLRDYFPTVLLSDAYRYGPGYPLFDFRSNAAPPHRAGWIMTNPPFLDLMQFIRMAYARAERGVALLMRAGVMEGINRYPLLYAGGECPLTIFAPFSERLPMHRGRWEEDGSTATFYAWFIWLKPVLRPRRFMVHMDGQWWPSTIPIAPGARKRLTRPSDAAYAVREAA
jgi:hypothetical protein